MACIFLLRHAQTSFGTDDYDRLSPLGTRQANIAGQFLAETVGPVARIVVGPLKRRRDTETVIAAKLREMHSNVPEMEINDNLDEHIVRSLPTPIHSDAGLEVDFTQIHISTRV